MRRRLLFVSVIILTAVGAWVLWPSSDETALSAAPADVENDAPSQERAARTITEAPRPGALTGFVKLDGVGVGGARVSLKATSPLTVVTLDDGAFRIDGIASEPVFVAAASKDLASDVLGPFIVEQGKTIEGLVLELKPTVVLDGMVRDVVTRAPIPRAIVSWSAGTAQTDGLGAFKLPAPKSQIWLDVAAKGYLSRTEWVSLELARTGGRLDLSLAPVSAIEGQVMEQGTPRAGVSVWAELTEGLRRGERSAITLTDAKGQFRIECSEGLRRVVAVTPAGVTVAGPEVRLAVGDTQKGVVVELGDLGPVTGVIKRDGVPLGTATLTLINAFTEDPVSTTTSFPDGRFSFSAFPVGRYLVQVKQGAFSTIAGPFDHRDDGQPWTVEVSGGQVLSGRVEPAAAGVRVRWRSGDWSGPSTETGTSADGSFRFEGVPAAQVLLDAEGPDGAATATAKPGDQVILRLQRGSVLVRVIDESGASVTDAVVLAKSDETGAVRKYVLMAPDGVFQIELPQGRWVLLADVAGRGRTGGKFVTVAGAPVDITLSLTATNPVTGVVVDKATRLPIQHARIRAESPMGRVSVTTDARGKFTLPPQPKQVQLLVGRDGYEPQGFYLPARADAANLTVELQPAPNRAFQDDPQRFEGVGMTLRPEPTRIVVQFVNEGSPAERAGVRAGDVVAAIEGAPAGADLQNVVSRIRGPAGTPVRLGFERDGRPVELVLRRKSLLITAW
ncbi:MAG: carboxypeptidase regulatory-like domain-containing protein [Myxococcales bacterium]|nr:carboxypeptidase regulatory-like domain-containing protein [Myxococcales bacterium]